MNRERDQVNKISPNCMRIGDEELNEMNLLLGKFNN